MVTDDPKWMLMEANGVSVAENDTSVALERSKERGRKEWVFIFITYILLNSSRGKQDWRLK